MHRIRSTVVALVTTTLLCSLLVVGAGPAGAVSTPVINVSPGTDLVNGSVVTVTGSGYNAGEILALAQCTSGLCDTFAFFAADATGSFTRPKTIATNVTASPSGSFSCQSVPCFVVVFRGVTMGPPPWPNNGVALAFRNSSGDSLDRALTFSQTHALVDGQSVTVSGTDWNTGALGIVQCSDVPALACAPLVSVMSDVHGSFTGSLTVTKQFTGTLITPTGNAGTVAVDCTDPASTPEGCFIAVSQGQPFSPDWLAHAEPISFAKPVPTSKDQCKNGGWADLVDSAQRPFRNQGDCVSFVASAGRNGATVS